MSSFGIYKENSNVNHTGVLLVYENHIITLDFDPRLCESENKICVRKYEHEDIVFDYNSKSSIYDFGITIKDRKLCVKIIKHLAVNINHEDLLFNMGDYHMFDNNCRVHVCKTVVLFNKHVIPKCYVWWSSDITPETEVYEPLLYSNINDCWKIILDSATKNYNKVLMDEKILIMVYDILRTHNNSIDKRGGVFDLSIFIDNVILEHCLKNYCKIIFSNLPIDIKKYIDKITESIDEHNYVKRETVISVVYTVLYYLDIAHNWIL